jgi:hypothetical protein
MSREFEMSMMDELQYFLGLQIKQVKDGKFMHQTKYTKDMLRKFQMQDVKPMSTPMGSTATLDADEDGEPVDQREYRSMIGSLLYLTATRQLPSREEVYFWFLPVSWVLVGFIVFPQAV